jgi:RNA polymerase sigma-70 factor (ECF subfamily)
LTKVSDAELIARAVDGNEKAFRELINRYHTIVYAVVQGVLKGRDDVEDVVQEVWIKMFRGLAKFRGDASFSTWMYRIARNEAINATRRAQLETQPVEDVDVRAPEHSRPDEQFGRTAQRHELDRYFAELEEQYRVVLELRYMGEKSYAEIAETMDLPIGTIKSYIHRAKIELKRVMTRTDLGKAQRKSQ